jgi:type I restriction enzyme S subunit
MWNTAKLGDVIEKGETINPTTNPDIQFNYIDVSSIDRMSFSISETQTLLGKDAPSRARRAVRTGDVLFATIRPTLQRVAIVPEELNGEVCSTGYIVLRPKSSILCSKFIFYYMLSEKVKAEMEGLQTGASYPAVNDTQVKNLDISYPPLAEQQRIVAKLDAAFAEIDGAIEAVAKSVDDVSRLLESKITDYLSNQNCSRTLTLKDVCEATQGVQIAKSNQSGEELDGYARYLYISDFSHDKNIKYVKNDYPKQTVFPTDIIVVNTGASAGKIFRGIPGILSNNLFKVSPVEALINADFLYHFVNSLIFKKYQAQIMRGTANPHMGHQNFLSTPIQLPEIAGQREIVEMVSCLLRHGETIQKAYIKKKISLSSLKSAILAQELQSEAA